MIRRVVAAWLALFLLGGMLGCGSAPVAPPESASVPTEAAPAATSDQAKLKEGLTGRELPASEVADLSDRLLADGSSAFNDQQTMARLELVILKTLQAPDKTYRAVLWRNLGIIHYHQQKYKQAEHDLQSANELNPKNARTHFYLARLFVQQGKIYKRKSMTGDFAPDDLKNLGNTQRIIFYTPADVARWRSEMEAKSRQQFKRAAIEIGLARKLEPSNSLYKQDPKQIIQQENGK